MGLRKIERGLQKVAHCRGGRQLKSAPHHVKSLRLAQMLLTALVLHCATSAVNLGARKFSRRGSGPERFYFKWLND